MIFCAHQTLYDNIDISEWKFLHAKYSCDFSGYVGPKKFHKQHILLKDVCELRVKSCTSQLHMKVILTIIEMSIMKRNNFFVIKLLGLWSVWPFWTRHLGRLAVWPIGHLAISRLVIGRLSIWMIGHLAD